MDKFLKKIKNIVSVLKAPLLALYFVILPKIVFAGQLHDIAEKGGWYSEACPLGTWSSDESSCMTCDLFSALFNAANYLSIKAYNAFASSMAILVAICTAIWVALKVLKYVSNMETAEPRQIVQELGRQLFRSMVIVLILSANYSSVRSLTIDPAFETGMRIANMFTGKSACELSSVSAEKNGGLSPAMGESIQCLLKHLQSSCMDVIDLGGTAVCLAFHDLSIISYIIPRISVIITGLALMAFGMVLLLGFPFLLVDCVVNLLFAVSLLPVALGLYAFKITANYLGLVWKTFMNAMFNFLFLSLILYVMMGAIATGFTELPTDPPGPDIFKAIKGLSFFGTNLITFGFLFLLAWSVLKESAELANAFSDGGINPSGEKESIGAGLGHLALQAGTRAAKTASSLGAPLAKDLTKSTRDAARAGRASIAMNRTKHKAAKAGNVAVNKDGSKTYTVTKKNRLTGKVTTTKVTVGKDGKKSMVKEETKKNGKKTRTISSGANKIKQKVYADGRTKTTSVKLSNTMETALQGKNNLPDTKALMAEISQAGSPEVQTALTEAVMDKMITKRINRGRTGINTSKYSYESRRIRRAENGNIEVWQKNKDGTTTIMSMKMSEKGLYVSGDRLAKDNTSRRYESNGIIERIAEYDANAENVIKAEVVGINNYMRANNMIDSNGTLNRNIQGVDVSFGFEDIGEHGLRREFDLKDENIRNSYMAFN